MKKRFIASIVSSVMAVTIIAITATTTGYAQCGCVCAWVCNNRCDFQCSGCGLVEGANAAARCCEQAHTATGDTGPCLEDGGSF